MLHHIMKQKFIDMNVVDCIVPETRTQPEKSSDKVHCFHSVSDQTINTANHVYRNFSLQCQPLQAAQQ